MAKRATNRKRSGCMTAGLIVLLPLCLIVGYVGFRGYNLYQAATSLQAKQEQITTLMNSVESVTSINPDEVDTLIAGLRQDVVKLDANARPFLPITPFLSGLPRIGPLMQDAEQYLDLADAATNAADTLRPTLQSALATAQAGNGISDTQLGDLLGLLQAAEGDLSAVEADVSRIQDAYATLESKEELPWAVRQYLPLVDEFLPQADAGLALAQIAPLLFNGDKIYHVWVQNNDELRGTGGFINGVVELRVQDGNLYEFEYQSSDDINGSWDYLDQLPTPPPPMEQFMNLPVWITQDASYYPDFPTAAASGAQLYAIQRPEAPPVDGVIAIDQLFVQKVLYAIGPTYVPALETSISGDNIIQVMRDSFDNPAGLEEGDNRIAARRDFVGQMTEALQARLVNDAGSLDPIALARTGLDALEARNVQIYLTDPSAAQTIRELGWDGSLTIRPNQDTLAVIDTNIGYNKVNAIVERSTRYEVSLSESGPHAARLSLTYDNPNPTSEEGCLQFIHYNRNTVYSDLIDRCFYNWLRFYPPLGTDLLSATETPISAESLVIDTDYDGIATPLNDPRDQSGFTNFMLIGRDTSLTTHFDLSLPTSIVQPVDSGYQYRLAIRKQAGTLPQATTVQVTLPSSATVGAVTPAPLANDGQNVVFQFDLETDEEIVVNYTLP